MNNEQKIIYWTYWKYGYQDTLACKEAIQRCATKREITKIDLVSDTGICYGVIEIPN